MSEEYEAIREALIALLCVGDEINYICISDKGHIEIAKDPVRKIREKYIFTKCWSFIPFELIEHYNGELYAWERYSFYTREEKVREMIKIIELNGQRV
jgi:hypothetical protein